ncbi:MBL fold metallo-hydrolase [Alkalihalobacillus sp. LMS39]|uniref:MBL fold metallo-hydrolase n=1 Tax=Alkalihalobacillus sp. LMS39 TaxID=2924032 RepID=UPI001FB4DE68|nr:MBL fold metallo-hydrolase [Alkalihalobacillus sp. LMS39]UOE94459.1 MBL fold metallo-hydrolase [Alkalihalobacillus sp. LMS39]
MKTTIQFWGGLKTIGGNIATIEYGKDRVVFDFGLVYDPATHVLDHHIKLREYTRIVDSIKLGLIPAMPGIYAKEELEKDKVGNIQHIPPATDEQNTAVFLSHLHLDHIGAMGWIAPTIPVYLSEHSLQLYRTLAEIGEGVDGNREYEPCFYKKPVEVGNITVTPLQVDHDVYGATSYHIKTPDGTLLYSGDIRMHGQHPEWNKQWIEDARKLGVDVLLIEGTTLHPTMDEQKNSEERLSERELPAYVNRMGVKCKGVMVINFYHRNVDRIQNFYEAATALGRTLVLEPKTAYIASRHLPDIEFQIFEQERVEVKKESWEIGLCEDYEVITACEINKEPDKFMLENSYPYILDLLDIQLDSAYYIHANGIPLGSFDPAYYNLLRFLERYGVEFHSLNISGHAYPEDLVSVVEQLKPNYMIPWHSYHPELLSVNEIKTILPRYGVCYELDNHMLFERK